MNVFRAIAGTGLVGVLLTLSGCGEAGSRAASTPSSAANGGDGGESRDAPVSKPNAVTGHIGRVQITTGGDGSARNITFDKLKFPMDDPKSRMFKAEYLTPEIKKLDGTRIRIRGFIFPTATDEVANFIFVRDNQECCFGPGATLYDSIMVRMEPGKTTNYVTRPVTVEGEFEIKELVGPDEKHLSIYRMTATSVE